MSEKTALIREALIDEEGAYDHVRGRAQYAVSLAQLDAKTKEAAIASLTRRGRFGSWLLKLHRGDRVTVHLHLYARLCRIIEELAREHEQRLAHELRLTRGAFDAVVGGDEAAGDGAVRPRLRAV